MFQFNVENQIEFSSSFVQVESSFTYFDSILCIFMNVACNVRPISVGKLLKCCENPCTRPEKRGLWTLSTSAGDPILKEAKGNESALVHLFIQLPAVVVNGIKHCQKRNSKCSKNSLKNQKVKDNQIQNFQKMFKSNDKFDFFFFLMNL